MAQRVSEGAGVRVSRPRASSWTTRHFGIAPAGRTARAANRLSEAAHPKYRSTTPFGGRKERKRLHDDAARMIPRVETQCEFTPPDLAVLFSRRSRLFGVADMIAPRSMPGHRQYPAFSSYRAMTYTLSSGLRRPVCGSSVWNRAQPG
jgi:hypothetical protein